MPNPNNFYMPVKSLQCHFFKKVVENLVLFSSVGGTFSPLNPCLRLSPFSPVQPFVQLWRQDKEEKKAGAKRRRRNPLFKGGGGNERGWRHLGLAPSLPTDRRRPRHAEGRGVDTELCSTIRELGPPRGEWQKRYISSRRPTINCKY